MSDNVVVGDGPEEAVVVEEPTGRPASASAWPWCSSPSPS